MILLTGAAGKTGLAILKQLTASSSQVRAFVRRPEQADQVRAAGAAEVVVGQFEAASDLAKAVAGIERVYHICPNVHPDEFEIGQTLLAAAQAAGVQHIVYHSVLHPQTRAMAHHWEKLRVEEAIFESELDFTILQPCAYFQNLLAFRQTILDTGQYTIPYSTTCRLSLVDLEDVALAAASVLLNPGHTGAIYELAGPHPLSAQEMVAEISQYTGRSVQATASDPVEWERRARQDGLPEFARNTLLQMFSYYDKFGLIGNPRALENLIGRPAMPFRAFLKREFAI